MALAERLSRPQSFPPDLVGNLKVGLFLICGVLSGPPRAVVTKWDIALVARLGAVMSDGAEPGKQEREMIERFPVARSDLWPVPSRMLVPGSRHGRRKTDTVSKWQEMQNNMRRSLQQLLGDQVLHRRVGASRMRHTAEPPKTQHRDRRSGVVGSVTGFGRQDFG